MLYLEDIILAYPTSGALSPNETVKQTLGFAIHARILLSSPPESRIASA
jgi:hypothetical protein